MEGGEVVVARTETSPEETTLRAELARIGVDVSVMNSNVVEFAAELIEGVGAPPKWMRRMRLLTAHAVAARLPGVDRATRNAHFDEVRNHWDWLIARGMDDKTLVELSVAIAERMTGE